ncbi:FAD-dependent monooxygenase [Aurantiacibacter gilvus]|uniref:FAD-dependent monooxygenase n=1 Tax=Aurantiacibacter gilvus TaxID=3139141 RepID=A0ABU9IFH3_9SPHN
MMAKRALIVGGGVGGMSAALALHRTGWAVTLIDHDPAWRVAGAGITLTGLSLRAFADLDILTEVRRRGAVGAGLRVREVDGTLRFETPLPSDPEPIDLGGGIMRPELHAILSERVRATDIEVRLGVGLDNFKPDDDLVEVAFSDGTTGAFEVVVGADGLHSSLRSKLFPDAAVPEFTGQGCWRIVAQRPAAIDRGEMYVGGAAKVGLVPVSESEMYMFILEHVPDNPWFAPEDFVPHVKQLLEPFGGEVANVRNAISEDSAIIYRPLEWHILEKPWSVGRIILIGDAAHGTTPHMASGAGLAVEDALALAEELANDGDVPAALTAYTERRFERAKLVVETSVGLGKAEMARLPPGAGALKQVSVVQKLRQPY